MNAVLTHVRDVWANTGLDELALENRTDAIPVHDEISPLKLTMMRVLMARASDGVVPLGVFSVSRVESPWVIDTGYSRFLAGVIGMYVAPAGPVRAMAYLVNAAVATSNRDALVESQHDDLIWRRDGVALALCVPTRSGRTPSFAPNLTLDFFALSMELLGKDRE